MSIYNYRTVMRGPVMPPKKAEDTVAEGTPSERWAKFQATIAAERKRAKADKRQDAVLSDEHKAEVRRVRGAARADTNSSRVLDAIRGKGEVDTDFIIAAVPSLTRLQVRHALQNLKKRGLAEPSRIERSNKGCVGYWIATDGESNG